MLGSKMIKRFGIFLLLCAHLVLAQGKALYVVGTANYYPPFAMYSADNTFYGFDISLMRQVCDKLDIRCRFEYFSFNQLLDKLKNNDIDFAIGAITITLRRKGSISFSNPYMKSYGRFLAYKTEIKQANNNFSLNNKTIGVQKGTNYETMLQLAAPKTTRIKTYETTRDLMVALREQEVDAVLVDAPTANLWASQSSGLFKLAGQPFELGEGLGIAISPENKDLVPQINQALDELKKEQVIEKLYQNYFTLEP